VFENRVLTGISGPKRGGVTGDWIKLRIEEHQTLYSPQNITTIKSKRVRLAKNVARIGHNNTHKTVV
jgi:hypothetical protein